MTLLTYACLICPGGGDAGGEGRLAIALIIGAGLIYLLKGWIGKK